MRLILTKLLAAGCIYVLSAPGMIQAQEAQPVVLEPYEKDFILFAGDVHSIYVAARNTADAAAGKPGASLDSFSVMLGRLPSELQELPEIKLEFQGTKYIVPARKVVIVATRPKEQGIFAQAALDPNGTGNYEVVLTINWSNWPDEKKKIDFLRESLPEKLEMVSHTWSTSLPKGGLARTEKFVFHNRTGQPFVLGTNCFVNLPTTDGWPRIEIPPAG